MHYCWQINWQKKARTFQPPAGGTGFYSTAGYLDLHVAMRLHGVDQAPGPLVPIALSRKE